MKLAFKKVGYNQKEVTIPKESLTLDGKISLEKKGLVKFQGSLIGKVEVECRRCGEKFTIPVDEKLFLKMSDGLFRGFDEEADVIEFYDNHIDFDEIIDSESESIKLDYHICEKCKSKEGE